MALPALAAPAAILPSLLTCFKEIISEGRRYRHMEKVLENDARRMDHEARLAMRELEARLQCRLAALDAESARWELAFQAGMSCVGRTLEHARQMLGMADAMVAEVCAHAGDLPEGVVARLLDAAERHSALSIEALDRAGALGRHALDRAAGAALPAEWAAAPLSAGPSRPHPAVIDVERAG